MEFAQNGLASRGYVRRVPAFYLTPRSRPLRAYGTRAKRTRFARPSLPSPGFLSDAALAAIARLWNSRKTDSLRVATSAESRLFI
jgi:hypothetical protein